ncbi:MAG TPA: DUF4097 family beta strand repeat-containing protein [Salinimicrobium sp.]|nr:DUF4097 family beta strand repeat-containing protein [Salinimicrobium sp.]
MRFILIILILFVCFSGYGQKQTKKVMDIGKITSIFISTDEVFNINIETKPVQTITIISRSGGEYYNDIGLETEIKRDKLIITSRFPEKLQGGYDKLSAHKVFSMSVDLEIPKGMKVEIISNLASVYGSGAYKNLVVQLKSGACYLTNFTGNAIVNTYSGNIEVETKNARITAHSRHGEVRISEFAVEKYQMNLTSIDGDIIVQKMDY